MSWVLVIEQNQELTTQIAETLSSVDPKSVVVHFSDSTSFLAWMDKIQRKETELEPPLPQDKFLGIVTAVETWKFKDVKLIGKFKALFVQMGFAASEGEMFVIFTAYESPQFQIKRFEHRAVNNVIFKPFDKLILQQVVDVAFKGRKALKNELTHTLKSQAQIEMLKLIQISAISEIGFQTLSTQKIEVGSIAKYYADFLETKQHRSALARTLSFHQPEGKEFGTVDLKFFALDQKQSFNLQQAAQQTKTRRTLHEPPAAADAYEFIFVKGDGLCEEILPSFERFYEHSSTPVESLAAATEFIKQAPESATKRFVFIEHSALAGNELAEVEGFLALQGERVPIIVILSRNILPEPLELSLSQVCEDIFYSPFNKSYIVKSLKRKWPDLRNKEEIYESIHELEQNIFVSNPVKLVEVSEAGLIFEYHREIHLGSFRDFHFTSVNETEVPTVVAQCNFNAPSPDGKSKLCHFVFFGMRDHELKFIRRWMLNQYVDLKQKSNA